MKKRFGMYYPVSETIVTKHPDLQPVVAQLDAYLRDNRGELIDIERVIDFIDMDDESVYANLLATYEETGVLQRRPVILCPRCNELLGDNYDCDICEQEYKPSEGRTATWFAPIDLGSPAEGDVLDADLAIAELDKRLGGTNTIINIKELTMRDSYKGKQVGAMGPNAQASNFQQIWNQHHESIDLEGLFRELTQLREEMKREASTVEHDSAVGEVAKAEDAAQAKDGPRTLQYLKAAGKWAFDVSTKIGTALATAALKVAIGLDT